MVSVGSGGTTGGSVGNRTQPTAGNSKSTCAFSSTDNRVLCPYCKGSWFEVKNTKTIDDGMMRTYEDGYGAAGTKDMIQLKCHCGREFGLQCAIAGDDWAAQ